MPFEPAPRDLPPAAKLAALIEAGRAANPDLKHGKGHFYSSAERNACALGLAAMAAGVPRSALDYEVKNVHVIDLASEALGLRVSVLGKGLTGRIARLNDSGASLDDIILSLREGELAKVPA